MFLYFYLLLIFVARGNCESKEIKCMVDNFYIFTCKKKNRDSSHNANCVIEHWKLGKIKEYRKALHS